MVQVVSICPGVSCFTRVFESRELYSLLQQNVDTNATLREAVEDCGMIFYVFPR